MELERGRLKFKIYTKLIQRTKKLMGPDFVTYSDEKFNLTGDLCEECQKIETKEILSDCSGCGAKSE